MNKALHPNETLSSRFWAKVNKDGPTPCPELGQCWVWTAPPHTSGYGYIGMPPGTGTTAHRVSYWLHYGRWPEPCCLHRCDNRLCVRPEHLFEGTVEENNRDMREKGRHARGDRHGLAKLRAQLVYEIRCRRACGEDRKKLAREYDISPHRISILCNSGSWGDERV